MTLVEFLLARLDEAEVVAKSIGADPRGVFRNFGGTWMRWVAVIGDRPWQTGRDYALADVESKRRLLALHHASTDHGEGHAPYCVSCWEADPCPTLRILARPYVDHPDFDEEWRS